MLRYEPEIKVALLQNYKEARLNLKGNFTFSGRKAISGDIIVTARQGELALRDSAGLEIAGGKAIRLSAQNGGIFTVADVKIGIDFHWQRSQEQSFQGNIYLALVSDSSFNLISEIKLEDYLESVISSEMSAGAPLEFLKAQAIVARSWLVAMLERKNVSQVPPCTAKTGENEIIAWKDVNDHEGFDVCADDHCQRYQGITGIISENVREAVAATRGMFLVSEKEICDARYHKACGGQTENFSAAWEDRSPAYLQSVSDSAVQQQPVASEADAARWLSGRPRAYCDTTDKELLSRILPAFDQETPAFYRWQVIYSRQDLEEIIRNKSGIDFGILQNLIPLERGASGRIYKLRIEGSRRTVTIGKELEIRRWLSGSHLLSSAFTITAERDTDGRILRFIFTGGGWGHGVGMCQIGAAVMASKGFKAEQILAHYFSGANLQKLY